VRGQTAGRILFHLRSYSVCPLPRAQPSGRLLWTSIRDVQRGISPLQWHGVWRDEDAPEQSAHDVLLFRSCLIRGALPLRDGAGQRVRDARQPCHDVLQLALTFVSPRLKSVLRTETATL
jgi:hypothetical protein